MTNRQTKFRGGISIALLASLIAIASCDSGPETEASQQFNTLSQAEKGQGWKLLFDGETVDGWHLFGKKSTSQPRWQTEGGELKLTPKGQGKTDRTDLVTDKEYESFELSLDWKISEAGNSGIFYNVIEAEQYDKIWRTGIEMQILDNIGHKDSVPKHRAGDLYDMLESSKSMAKPVGQWNQAKLVVKERHVEHWLNGVKLLEYVLGSDDWNSLVENSKFKSMPDFAKSYRGHIALQDHGDPVWFRNIKIREL